MGNNSLKNYPVVAPNRSYNDFTQLEQQILQGGGGGGAVTSVNGKTGAVVLTNSDVNAPTVEQLNNEITTRENADNSLQNQITQNKSVAGDAIKITIENTGTTLDVLFDDDTLKLNTSNKLYANIIDDINSSLTKTFSSSKIIELINSLSGKATIKVVDTKPTTPELNTLYYVGTASPYHIWLYTSEWYDMGTTEIDLSNYIKKTDVVDNLTSTATQFPLSANQGKVLKDLVDEKVDSNDGVLTGTTNAQNIVVSGDLTCDGDTTIENGTVSGELDVPTPTTDNQVVNKKYVDDEIAKVATLQSVYDAIYPVNSQIIGFNAPTVPTGVTATWEEDTTYDGKALWIDSTKTAGTSLSGSLPNILGTFGGQVYSGNNNPAIVFTNHTGSFSVGDAGTNNTYLTGQSTGTAYYQYKLYFNAQRSSQMYSGVAGNNVVRPTSVVIHIFKRTA